MITIPRRDGTPDVEISARGSLLLNEAAYTVLVPTHVVQLTWDEGRQELSIQAVWPKIDGSHWILRHNNPWPRPGIPSGATYSIDAAQFFRLHGIKAAARHYSPEFRDRTLIISLR